MSEFKNYARNITILRVSACAIPIPGMIGTVAKAAMNASISTDDVVSLFWMTSSLCVSLFISRQLGRHLRKLEHTTHAHMPK